MLKREDRKEDQIDCRPWLIYRGPQGASGAPAMRIISFHAPARKLAKRTAFPALS